MTLPNRRRSALPGLALAAVLAALPFAVWLELRALTERSLHEQAADLTQVITTVRTYYSDTVVESVLSADTGTRPRADYAAHPGAIPLPATLSLELGAWIGLKNEELVYRFVSDRPFAGRLPHALSPTETGALAAFRASRDPEASVTVVGGTAMERQLTRITPVVMDDGCVACHNAHPGSPVRDWAEGDVRGIQVVSLAQSIVPGLSALGWLLAYFALAAMAGATVIVSQIRLTRSVGRLADELAGKNAFLADVSEKIATYLPPQVCRAIVSGETAVAVAATRKKLTVFVSDIADFTSTTERLQPEEITALLNEYFTEMTRIADRHGATVDKFLGDGLIAFFGDPTSRGTAEDARACLRMALEMQGRMASLADEWRARGIETPFRARMGINTGFCTVGNFGSETRLDYTAVGAEVNLAARLQGQAAPGDIVVSYETLALVSDLVAAEALPEMTVKGIPWPVRPFRITGKAQRPAPSGPARQRTRIAPLADFPPKV